MSKQVVSKQCYMVIETFKNGNTKAVYRRLREQGRMLPEGLTYVSSWIADDLKRCYQVMETADRTLLDEWMAAWSDLIRFETQPVINSEEAASRVEAL